MSRLFRQVSQEISMYLHGISPEDRITSVESLLRAMLWLMIFTTGLTTMLFTAFLIG